LVYIAALVLVLLSGIRDTVAGMGNLQPTLKMTPFFFDAVVSD